MGSLPVDLVATLALGLRDDSRLKMALRGDIYTFEQIMMVRQFDALQIGNYLHSRDAQKGRNRPKSMFEAMMKASKRSDFQQFDNVEDLKKAIERSKHV